MLYKCDMIRGVVEQRDVLLLHCSAVVYSHNQHLENWRVMEQPHLGLETGEVARASVSM